MLIAENQDLLLYEDIDNLIEEFLVQLFRQVHARNSDTELVDKGCIFSGIDLASSTFLYGKWDTAFKLPTRPRICDARYAIAEYQRSGNDRSLTTSGSVSTSGYRHRVRNRSLHALHPYCLTPKMLSVFLMS
jgi:hypothetical protein